MRAVVTLNEDFEVFISTEQYKVCPPMRSSYADVPEARVCTLPRSRRLAVPSCPAAACKDLRNTCRPGTVRTQPAVKPGAVRCRWSAAMVLLASGCHFWNLTLHRSHQP